MVDTDNISVILCTEGLILPCWYPLENVSGTEKTFRGLLYFLFMIWLFIGVAIVCDQFMAAIEKITSQEREVSVRKPNGEKQIVVVKIWNETVANLTLMALGSSAPEILLSIIEIYAKNFEAGELGPGTIVGSAAYNLFVIIAICVVVIPKGEVKRIKHLDVFFVTATWSVFAYIWMYLIISVISPGEVEIWEGLFTLFFFFATVLTAYAADIKIYKNKNLGKFYSLNRRGTIVESEAADNLEMENSKPLLLDGAHDDLKQEYIDTLKELRHNHPHIDIQLLEKMAYEDLLTKGHKSRAFYRIQATRKLMGTDISRRISDRAQTDLDEIKTELQEENDKEDSSQTNSKVFFEPSKYTVFENCGTFEVRVVRTGNIHVPLSVEYTTEDGTAQVGNDYVKAEGTLHFNPGEFDKRITVEIIDDDVFGLDQHFYVKLSSTKPVGCLGFPMLATVIILDDDYGGLFKFETQNHELVESIGTYELKVIRCTGVRGRIILPYCTEDGTAKSGKEFDGQQGELIFENNESE